MKIDNYFKRILYCLFVLLAIYILYGLYRTYQESDIVRIDYVGTNPTEYTFPAPIDSVRKCILYIGHYGKFKGLRMMDYDGDSLILRDIVPPKFSYVYTYRSKNKRKYVPNPRQHYEFKIDLVAVSQGETKVIVNTIKHTIVSGVKFWGSLTFDDRYVAKSKDVESTTIEEYELLRYIGKLLGHIDSMPYVNYPSSLSRHEILQLFGNENPFSPEEMFGDKSDVKL
ncbi:MAG: hypothetical protein IJ383_03715 [Bacteroidales bacterium]|nr:hypothetical protein [Bacteroidales bacterium]